jgi:hypothetical protein
MRLERVNLLARIEPDVRNASSWPPRHFHALGTAARVGPAVRTTAIGHRHSSQR